MTTLLFIPTGDADYTWLRLGGDAGVVQGDGLPPGDDAIVAVPPADAVTLHWAELPTRSVAQAVAAARLLAAEASAAPVSELHVAVGEEGDGTERPIGVVSAGAMRDWLERLAAVGVDPVVMIPAPLLLPRPDAGYFRADVAGQGLVRGRIAGFADEARLTDLVTGDTPPVQLDRTEIDAAMAAAAANPALDLRQGAFARRTGFTIDWRLVRRLAVLAAVILLVSLTISLVRLAKYSFAADRLEAQADALAATALPRGETVVDPGRQLSERQRRTIGPGAGFSTTAAAAFAAVRGVEGTEITAMDFTPDGSLRLSVATAREALATDLKRALENAGFAVRASTFAANNGRVTGELTVTAR